MMKSDVVPGAVFSSARYPQVMVVGWWKGASKGMVRCDVWTASGERRDGVLLPYQVLRY